MTLLIFNPDHDIALAANIENFTSPHAGRQLHHDLGFLPALWAQTGDMVFVDDEKTADEAMRRVTIAAKKYLGINLPKTVTWATRRTDLDAVDGVDPWGWDLALRARLQRCGVKASVMPTDDELEQIRQLSHRRTASQLLSLLISHRSCRFSGGLLPHLSSLDQLPLLLEHHGRIVLKAPWSSSGRGIRFVDNKTLTTSAKTSLYGWVRNVIDSQGCVMAEPYYDKVKDFGMEFFAQPDGRVKYCGLSLFHTQNGAYTGNILATEKAKLQMMCNYFSEELLNDVKDTICEQLTGILQGRYHGPLGVDMMVCRSTNFTLHPCVEINLRRTMGHVALSLTPTDDDRMAVMRTEYSRGSYRLQITNFKLPE